MENIKTVFELYKTEAGRLEAGNPEDLNAALIALENRMADNSGLGEGDRLEARAYMEEYRRKRVNGYKAGADSPPISEPWSGPRSEDQL
ncbi:MAG: hypothetical protein EOP49_18535 [Sphingobacteriales bacterium]|nr:MAG: hypothetical protein EOP49_18535 [Sphingobacteriales bacterium]